MFKIGALIERAANKLEEQKETVIYEQQSKLFWKNYYNTNSSKTNPFVICEVNNNNYLGLGLAIFAYIVAKIKKSSILFLYKNNINSPPPFMNLFPKQKQESKYQQTS